LDASLSGSEAVAFSGALDYRGFTGVELKYSTQDGRYRLMELTSESSVDYHAGSHFLRRAMNWPVLYLPATWDASMRLSVVVPVLNEEENVEELCARISSALASGDLDHEIIFVDDGSTDATVDRLRRLQEADPRIRVVKLRRNYGQTPAMRAGIDYAKGDVIVTMDGDLQNDPSDIPMIVQKLEEGFDLVAGWRRKRKDPFLTRKLPSKIANWLIGKITGVPIRDNGCSLKAYRAEVIKNIPLYSEMHRFIPAMSSLAGVRIAEVAVNHHPRIHGESKYGLSRTGKVLLDLVSIKMLIACSQRPLHWFGLLSILFVAVSLISGASYLWTLAFSDPESVRIVFPSLCVLFGCLAVQLVFLGLLADLILRMGKPHDFYAVSREHRRHPE
jgi:glycosyltransferase involved in cell wall biosynthesis